MATTKPLPARDSKGRFTSSSGAKVKVDVDTKDAQKNLKDLKKAAQDTKKELSGFDKVVNSAFGSKNAFQITNFNRALTSMVDTMKTVSLVMIAANTAIVTFFGAIIKELNKLQGFLSIMTLSANSTEAANQQFMFLRNTANLLGLDLNALTANYAKLTAAIPDSNEKFSIAQKMFTGLAMAARTLHASTLDTQLMFYAVTQMASKGVISMEELRRQLGERLPGAMQIAARGLNTTTDELEKAIRKGIVQSVPFIKYFGDELIRTFAASSDIAANTVDASLNRLTNVWVDFVKAILDSGAGQAIVGVFDALREKLADPYIYATFAQVITEISGKVTAFIKSLTQADVANAFTALANAIQMIVNVTQEMIRAFTWVINNSKLVGTIVGALTGAGKGAAAGFMVAGPWGAAVGAAGGAVVGGAGGAWLGGKFQVDTDDVARYEPIRAEAERLTAEKKRMEAIMLRSVMGSMSELGFSGSDMGYLLPMIEKRLGFDAETAAKFASIFNEDKKLGPVFRNLQERQAAVLTLATTGQILGPRGTLEETYSGGAKGGKGGRAKKDPVARIPKDEFPLKEGLDYIAMLQKKLAVEEDLSYVDRMWLEMREGRLKFNSAENFLRAESIALMLDEKEASDALGKAQGELSNVYRDQMDKLQDRLNKGLMTSDQSDKNAMLREFDQKLMEQVQKIPAGERFDEARVAAYKLADVLRNDLATAFDKVVEQSRSFEYGWRSSLIKYSDDVTNYAKTAEQFFTTAVSGMEDAFVQFATTGKLSFRSLIDSMIADLARFSIRILMDQAIKMIFGQMLNAGMFGNGLAGGDGFVTSNFAGRAAGGPVRAGQTIWVGENGKELFTPPTNGKIIPNHEIGGAPVQPVNITYHIGAIGSNVSRQDIAVALDQTRQTTIAQIREMNRRNTTVIR